jgi:hypothetical protein
VTPDDNHPSITRTTFQLRLFATELETGRLLTTEVDEALAGLPP